MGSGSSLSKRKKKRSQKHSKKRSSSIRKKKTKKLKRRHDSVLRSDDDSASVLSVPCSSSSLEEDSRSKRRARSRDRKDRKSRKKRTDRGSSMSDSSADTRRVKKRKRSKRKRDSDLGKKKRKKMRKREPSISTSSDQLSDDSERERGRKREKSGLKERKGREKRRERSGSKRSRHSSRSCSPCSLPSENHTQSYLNEEIVMEENRPKRLKSVIVAVFERQETEIGELNRDGHKDEIIYEHDDYPSKSNDSNDGVSKREELSYLDDASYDNIRSFEDPNREVVTSEFSGSQKLDVERSDRITSSLVGSVADDHLKVNSSDIPTANAGSDPGNLEATLRQKALENLLRRQGKLPAKIPADNTDDNRIEVKKSSFLNNESDLRRHSKEDGSNNLVPNVGSDDNVKHTNNSPRARTDHDVRPPSRKLEVSLPAKKANTSDNRPITRPKLDSPTLMRRFLGSSNTWKRELASQESPKLNLSIPKETTGMNTAKGSESSSPDTKLTAEKVDSIVASEPSPSGEKSSKDETNEADDDSQFQQKTMSVMRGGELVQVTYKVKIPKKAPALARRQLKR